MNQEDFGRLVRSHYGVLELDRYKIAYIYSDFRGFASDLEGSIDRDRFCNAIVDPLLESGMTILAPTFTYTTEGVFETSETSTRVGLLNRWLLKQEGVRRSEHPLFSYAALGPQADLVENIGKSAFGRDSIFDRLQGRQCSFVHIGHEVSRGNTALHHVEHLCGATYRIHKAFKTQVYRSGHYVGTDYTAFLRRLDVQGQEFHHTFEKAAATLRQEGLIQETGDPEALRGIGCYDYDQAVSLLFDAFHRDPTIFIGTDFLQY
jgi:aminoglycoside N3'-acetyltransferase